MNVLLSLLIIFTTDVLRKHSFSFPLLSRSLVFLPTDNPGLILEISVMHFWCPRSWAQWFREYLPHRCVPAIFDPGSGYVPELFLLAHGSNGRIVETRASEIVISDMRFMRILNHFYLYILNLMSHSALCVYLPIGTLISMALLVIAVQMVDVVICFCFWLAQGQSRCRWGQWSRWTQVVVQHSRWVQGHFWGVVCC